MNFIKPVISILLLAVLVAGIGIKSVLTIHYFVNQTEIIELFCINKEKPQLQCNGKCHLAQELKEIEPIKGEQPFLPTATHLNMELVFTLDHEIKFEIIGTSLKKQSINYTKKELTQFSAIITPPPKIIT